jgi:hypothetical protein
VRLAIAGLAWAGWMLASAMFLDTYRPNEQGTALGLALLVVNLGGCVALTVCAVVRLTEGDRK